MKKETIKSISIEDFKLDDQTIDYADEDFIVMNSLRNLPHTNEAIKLNCFIAVFCVEGCIQLDINGKSYLLEANDLVFGLPNAIISHTMMSPNHVIKIMGFSTRILQRVLKIERHIWSTISYVHNNPVKHAEEKDYISFNLYKDLIMAKINEKPHRYHKEIIQYLFSALLCEILAELNKYADDPNIPQQRSEAIKQADHILKRFLEKLSEDNGTHRSVTYYANELFYTPKYLSKVVKQASGKNALYLINQHAIECIKYKLKHSDKSIKEIAEELNFSNLSFFGKYVKTHLGVSPIKYRNMLEK